MLPPDPVTKAIDNGPFCYDNGITLTVRRLDTLDPVTGGNKGYKMKGHLDCCKKQGFKRLVTFGGTWSNHLAATARICRDAGIRPVAFVRGEPASAANVTLSRAIRDGMRLIFVTREAYRQRNVKAYWKKYLPDVDDYYWIPEGGAGPAGVEGCMQILDQQDAQFRHVVVACGTGTTAAGIIAGVLQPGQHVTGVAVLKAGDAIEQNIREYLSDPLISQGKTISGTWSVEKRFHFGGYARSTPELQESMRMFQLKTAIPIEPVYTGKLFFAIESLIKEGYFPAGSNILALHTGGLQYFPEFA